MVPHIKSCLINLGKSLQHINLQPQMQYIVRCLKQKPIRLQPSSSRYQLLQFLHLHADRPTTRSSALCTRFRSHSLKWPKNPWEAEIEIRVRKFSRRRSNWNVSCDRRGNEGRDINDGGRYGPRAMWAELSSMRFVV